MARQLTRHQVEKKYSQGYLKLILANPWIQGYRYRKHSWDEEYQGFWLPSFVHLWKLIETFIPVDPEKVADIPAYLADKLVLKKVKNKFIAKLSWNNQKHLETQGDCPEEALLKLFIRLEKS